MTATTASSGRDEGRITFKMSQDWSIRDLALLTTHLEVMYGVLLSLYVLPRLGEDPHHPRWALMSGSGTRLLTRLTEGWSGSTGVTGWAYDPDLASLRYGDAFIDLASTIRDYDYERADLLRLLHASVYRGMPESVLRVTSIKMSSPGSISLSGLGEPLRELRELIKDLWYRNKQEKRRGELELEILQTHLNRIQADTIIRQENSVDRALIYVANSAEILSVLQEQGKLEPPTTGRGKAG
jgi:hypothetical protein